MMMNIFAYIKAGLKHKMNPLYVHYLMGKKVLDVGCGRGEFLLRDQNNYVGVDIDPALVTYCQQKGLVAYSMSALKLDFPVNSFDAIHAAQLIEHFNPDDASHFLAEAAKTLKPGGVLYLTTPGTRTVWNTFSHIRPYPPDAFKKILSSATENYIRESGELGLCFEAAWGTRFHNESRVVMFLLGILDLLFPPSNPIGWTIVLRKGRP